MTKSIAFLLLGFLAYSCHSFVEEGDLHKGGKSTKRDILKMDGPERYLAFHEAIRTNTGSTYPDYQEGYRQTALSLAKSENRASKKRSAPLPWIERGPGNVGGRTRGIWVDPRDTSAATVFAGSVGGGIWKTTDAGQTWRNLTADFPNLATASLAGGVSNPDVIYAGTGEGFGASRNILGDGIWKTTDGGESWQQLASTVANEQISAVYRIIVNPDDDNELLFCTLTNPRLPGFGDPTSYIFKSMDGGNTIAPIYTSERAVQQLVADPNNFNRIYATVNGRGVLRSTNGGTTWRFIYETTEFGRLELAISPSNPRHIYITAQSDPPENALDQNTSHLIYSSNGGTSWFEVSPINTANDFGDWFNGQGWYDNTLAVHPFDSQVVYVGGAGPILEISIQSFDRQESQYLATMQPVTDGYRQYFFQYPEARSKGVHVDHHELVLIPRDSVKGTFFMIDGNDGGVAISQDGGKTFIQTGDSFKSECVNFNCSQRITYETAKGYNTAQFYGVDKKNGADRYVAGSQDNGSWVSTIDPGLNSSWLSAPSGDGFETVWHYQKTNQLIESSQFNNIFRSDDDGRTWRMLSPPGDGPFLTRLAGSQQDPDLIFGVTEQGIIKSFDFGDHWQTISMPEGWRFEGLGTPVRISLANPNVVWTGSGLRENAQVALSTDGGTSFSLVSRYEGATLGLITNIATHPFNDSIAYFLFSQANGPKVVCTKDFGQTFEDLSGFETNQLSSNNGYPDVATYSLLVMPFDENIIWAGTEIGLFETLNGGESWSLADNGIPNAAIWDMKIVNDEVVVATHGRGIWTVTLPELENYEPLAADFLAPQILLDKSAFAGRISGEVFVRSSADSSIVNLSYMTEGIAQEARIVLKNTNGPSVIRFENILKNLVGENFVEVTAIVNSYSGNTVLRSFASEFVHPVDTIPIVNYQTSFDDGKRDFALLDWEINNPSALEGASLNSPHPYPNLDLSKAVFKKPILVTESTKVDFDEIVLVEPGDSDEFPSEDFFDYCQIEATADFGVTWITIAGYDSRAESTWLEAYNRDENAASTSLYMHRNFNLGDFFEAGDTVYLRFNLFSDPRLEGWGWTIDNFEINGEVTPTIEFASTLLDYKILGNPASDFLRVAWQSDKRVTLDLSIISLAGQAYREERISIGSHGSLTTSWDISGLPAGTYFLLIKNNLAVKSLKWVKL
jgi:photosystem II stability/assembly factor-like uncharacterized protein